MDKVVTVGFVLTLLITFCEISHSAYIIDDSSGVERKFDGIGGLSGGGATSKLLVNYPEDLRNQILDYLFKPNFGASLQILKVEIGGDAQSTDGTESSHMHDSWDENYERGYEWWLMLEAKKRNPLIKLYGLPWAFPGWVGRGTGDPYRYPNDTATYVTKWVTAAKKMYNLDIDYIGIWNERNYNIQYVETLKATLVASGLTNVKLVVSDGGWDVSHDIRTNPTFAGIVDTIGCHYPGTTTSMEALQTGKALWASEDYSTFNDDIGAGCWARILNQNYVNGFMTSTISWNLIASYYLSLPYPRNGLMTASEPWSGHYTVDNPVWVTAHTTQFTDIGWHYLKHGQGVGILGGGGSYVSLVSPKGDQLTIIIETMTHDHSICIRPSLPAYTVVPQQAMFELSGSLMNIQELYVWKTQLLFNGTASTAFVKQDSIKPVQGVFTLNLELDQIYTLTTVTTAIKGSYAASPKSQPFPLPYVDNYDSYKEYSEAYNFAPQIGVWEVRATNDPIHKQVNRQVVLSEPINWCDVNPQAPKVTLNIVGNNLWTDISVQVDIFVPSINGSTGAYVAARVDHGGCDSPSDVGIFFFVFPATNRFLVTLDLAMTKVAIAGTCSPPISINKWHTIRLMVQGNAAYGSVDLNEVMFGTVIPASISSGFAAYGTASLGVADFDNVIIQSSNLQMMKSQDVHYFKDDNKQSSRISYRSGRSKNL